MNTAYFQKLNQSLKSYKRAIPSLLVDLDRLDQNIQALKKLMPEDKAFRIVVKSLPSIPLIDYVMGKMDTNKLMVFHQPFLSEIAHHYGKKVDVLIGKPMPALTADYFYQTLDTNSTFQADKQVQWLIDTEQRLKQYIELAKKHKQKILVSLEIDVGLHRGGFGTLESLCSALKIIEQNQEHLKLAGFMGYDPHVAHLPKILRSPKKSFQFANDFYKACIEVLKSDFQDLWHQNLTFNGAGSPTLPLHKDTHSVLNDVSTGSALVKPTHFDIPSLSSFIPACFITTPVLKKMKGTTLPGLEKLKGLFNLLRPFFRKSYFIYGGYWKADYYFPPKTRDNPLFGPSTNQTMVNSASNIDLEVDDFIFLRPTQSEFVFLQFGNIIAMRGGEIETEWPILQNAY
jgi:D-serine deaminase-like pyridoxal phosphate-dependent protein